MTDQNQNQNQQHQQNQKMVKVKILRPVHSWKAGEVVEVSEEQAKHMTTPRQVHNGTNLEEYQTAELADSGAEVGHAGIANMTVKDMADLGMKNVVEIPKGAATDDSGKFQAQLSTTTNEAVPHATGASMASLVASSQDEEDMSSSEGSAGYDGSNVLSHTRDGSKTSAPAKQQQPKKAQSGNAGQAQQQQQHPASQSAPHKAQGK